MHEMNVSRWEWTFNTQPNSILSSMKMPSCLDSISVFEPYALKLSSVKVTLILFRFSAGYVLFKCILVRDVMGQFHTVQREALMRLVLNKMWLNILCFYSY